MVDPNGQNQNNPNDKAFKVLSRVETYYNNSFKKLAKTLSVGLGILLTIIAIAGGVQYYSIDKAEKRLTSRIEKLEEQVSAQKESSLEKIDKTKEDFVHKFETLEKQVSGHNESSRKEINKAIEDFVNRLGELEGQVFQQNESSRKEINKAIEDFVNQLGELEGQIFQQNESSLEKVKKSKEDFTHKFETLEKKIAEQQKLVNKEMYKQNRLALKNINDAIKRGEEKIDKDLAAAMAKNYESIARIIPSAPHEPFLGLIRSVVYIEAALEYAKYGEQDKLQATLELVLFEDSIKINRKYIKDKLTQDMYRKLYFVIERKTCEINSILGEKEYEDKYSGTLIETIQEKVRNAQEDLDKKR